MKETGGISKSQYTGTTKLATCRLCGEDVSKLSWEKQQKHVIDCVAAQKLDAKQTKLM